MGWNHSCCLLVSCALLLGLFETMIALCMFFVFCLHLIIEVFVQRLSQVIDSCGTIDRVT